MGVQSTQFCNNSSAEKSVTVFKPSSAHQTTSKISWNCMENYNGMIELFFKTSYGSGLSVCIFVALCLCVLGCLLQGPIRLKVQCVDAYRNQ